MQTRKLSRFVSYSLTSLGLVGALLTAINAKSVISSLPSLSVILTGSFSWPVLMNQPLWAADSSVFRHNLVFL